MDVINMKQSKTFKWLALCVLAAMLFTGCAPVTGYTDQMTYQKAKILSTINVADAAAKEDALYAQNDDFSLYVNEKMATFYVVDKNGNRWDSVPAINPEDYANNALVFSNLQSLVQVHYNDMMNNTSQARSYSDSVMRGTTDVMRIPNGVRFEFEFQGGGVMIPIQVTLQDRGVDISLINAEIEETGTVYTLTSVDVAPYFGAPHKSDEGYIVLPDGSGALVDWNKAADTGVKYRQSVYGRDNAIIVNDITAAAQPIRLPVFGSQFKRAELEGDNVRTTGSLGFAAYVTEGASRAMINAACASGTAPYSSVFAEFVYRETAMVKVEKKGTTVRVVETSHTQIPVQNVRYDLLADTELDYVDIANAYRGYLLRDRGIQSKTGSSAPLVIDLFGGVMKQQFVMGFPVDQVVSLTSFEDAQTIVKKLKEAGVDDIIINYTEWQKDATGSAIQTAVKPEGNLGGNKGLKELIALCKQENVGIYLNMNTHRMVESSFGYNTSYDSAASVRRDPAMQYYYKVNTGTADVLNPSFCLVPHKVLDVAGKLSASAKKYDLTGVSSDFLGASIYSDFAKNATTRDHTQFYWNDTLKTLAGTTGKLILAGGNDYALDYASFITDAPVTNSGFLLECEAIPLYQIVVHGIVPISTGNINEATDTRQAFLYAVETGSCLKWNWTAANQDELVETNFNTIISSHYENWLDMAVAQYKEANALLKKLANCSITAHQKLTQDLVRVTWSDGTVVYVNYGAEAVSVDGVEVPAQNFAVKGGAV